MKIFITAMSMDERKEGLSILIREWLCPVTGLSERFIPWTVKAREQLNYLW